MTDYASLALVAGPIHCIPAKSPFYDVYQPPPVGQAAAVVGRDRGRMRGSRREGAAPSRTLLQRPPCETVLLRQGPADDPPFGRLPLVKRVVRPVNLSVSSDFASISLSVSPVRFSSKMFGLSVRSLA